MVESALEISFEWSTILIEQAPSYEGFLSILNYKYGLVERDGYQYSHNIDLRLLPWVALVLSKWLLLIPHCN